MLAVIILAVLAAVVLLLLCVPLDMVFVARTDARPKLRIRYSWLFGAVSREITGAGKKATGERPAGEAKQKRRRGDIRGMFRIIKTPGLLPRFLRLAKGLLSRFRFRELQADITIGLGDPADTGLLFAFIGPAAGWLGASRFHSLRIEPSFSDELVWQCSSQGTLRVRPVCLFPPLVKFVFSSPAIRMFRTLIASKWKRGNR